MENLRSFCDAPFWRLAQVRMAGVVLLLQVLTAAAFLAMSGVYRERDEREALAVRTLVDAARRASAAQADFKAQVQEWKNILLRGADPADFAQYRSAMNYRATQFSVALGLVDIAASGVTDAFSADIQAADREASALLAAYETALGDRSTLSAAEARTVDAKVRGIDRALEERVDRLSDQLLVAGVERQRQANAASRERASRLGATVLGGLALSISAVFALLLLSLRST